MPRKDDFTTTEFKDEMSSNALGSDQSVKKVAEYIVEFYGDSFTIGEDYTKPRLQVFAIATDSEDHYRKWKKIADDDDFEEENVEKLYRQITGPQIRQHDPLNRET